MITAIRMSEIIKSRGLQVISVKVSINGSSIGWVAKTIDGTRAAPRNEPYPTPEEAVEAADAWLTLSETAEKDRKGDRLIKALERGRYYIRPIQSSGASVLFTAYLPDGTVTSVKDRLTFIQAVLDMEGLLP